MLKTEPSLKAITCWSLWREGLSGYRMHEDAGFKLIPIQKNANITYKKGNYG